MKLVIDTNRLLAAMIRKGITREIIHSQKFQFVTPEFTIQEIIHHKETISKKTGMKENEIEELFLTILFDIEII